ncbi:MAG: gluconolaconase, partial [Deltaproteobacteria bacterium]|nr:gluconolaconase [Deltaproteobacteria bacterium]
DGRIAMTDYVHQVVEILDPATGATTILAGVFDASGYVDATGAAARFARPYGIAVRDGALIVADYENHRIRSVDLATGAVTTLAGSGVPGTADGALATAQFDLPQGVAVDAAGTIYVTDTGSYRVRRIRNGTVETIAGDGVGGFRDDDDPLIAEFYGLEGLAVAPDGAALYVADGSRGEALPYNRVRIVDLTP